MSASDEEGDQRFVELGQGGFALAMQLLRNREDAADAVQDSLVAMLRKGHTFNAQRGDLRAWFLKIVRNRCLDLLRKRARRGRQVQLTEISSTANRPDVAAEQREMRDVVKRELMALSDKQREIILLRDYHNLSYAGVAQVLSIPVGTVMSRLHRARTELQRRLREYR